MTVGASEPPAGDALLHFGPAFAHAPVGMALVSSEDRVIQVNPALCRMAGLLEHELIGRTLADLSHPDDRDAAAALRGRLFAGERPTSTTETRLRRSDGLVVWALVGGALVPAHDGQPEQLMVQVVDITAQKRAERELLRSNADLSSFAYLAAHELRSPLQTISGFAALLERLHGSSLDPQAQGFLGWICDGSSRMNALIDDLLTYCSVDAAASVLGPVPLGEVMSDALAQMEEEMAERAAIVDVGSLPVVTADGLQVGQVLQNLLANALKFVPQGTTPTVHLSAERGPEGWTVTVADNGIGVEDPHRDRIFSMFQRLHSRERYKGTGIGLSICKRIVERRGGAIWVEPNPGGGSRFRFTIPDAVPGGTGGPEAA